VYRLQLQICSGHDSASLHGLWPEWAEYCDGPKFEISKLHDLQPELEQKWASCTHRNNRVRDQEEQEDHAPSSTSRGRASLRADTWFWRHEWERHGKCAAQQFFPNDPAKVDSEGEHAYFEKALQLATDYAPRCKEKTCHWCLRGDDFTETQCPRWHGREITSGGGGRTGFGFGRESVDSDTLFSHFLWGVKKLVKKVGGGNGPSLGTVMEEMFS